MLLCQYPGQPVELGRVAASVTAYYRRLSTPDQVCGHRPQVVCWEHAPSHYGGDLPTRHEVHATPQEHATTGCTSNEDKSAASWCVRRGGSHSAALGDDEVEPAVTR